ncbi:uncharacterized protein [Nicotiana tomentosiformis]|uniref:uncharacterized protein n=1 Tax=Nicotiana tomentosiformis TaxID=4098 RepID=UPI00388CBC86
MRGRGYSRGRGRGRGATRTAVRATPVDPPIALTQEQVPDMVEPVGLALAPAMPIVIAGLQEALSKILTMCTSLAQAVSVPAATATFQAGGGSSDSYSGSQGHPQYLPPLSERGCFKCGDLGHLKRHCPRFREAARGHPRRGDRLGGGQAIYALPARPDAVASDTMITGIVSVCDSDASALFDPGSTYSYVSSYFARYMDMNYESLVSSVHVSTPVGDTIIVDRIYRSCVVTIEGLKTRVDLLLLSMVDFDVILGMNWLSPCHAILDCHTKTMTLAITGLPMIEWRGSLDYVPSRVILYLKAQQIVKKGCLSYIVFVRDVGADTPTIDSVLVVRDCPDVFPAELPGIPPDRDIDFGIDLMLGTQPISIPLYCMVPAELKILKEQL